MRKTVVLATGKRLRLKKRTAQLRRDLIVEELRQHGLPAYDTTPADYKGMYSKGGK